MIHQTNSKVLEEAETFRRAINLNFNFKYIYILKKYLYIKISKTCLRVLKLEAKRMEKKRGHIARQIRTRSSGS